MTLAEKCLPLALHPPLLVAPARPPQPPHAALSTYTMVCGALDGLHGRKVELIAAVLPRSGKPLTTVVQAAAQALISSHPTPVNGTVHEATPFNNLSRQVASSAT